MGMVLETDPRMCCWTQRSRDQGPKGGGREVFSSEILVCSILMVGAHISMGGAGESIDRVWHSGSLGDLGKPHKYSTTTRTML